MPTLILAGLVVAAAVGLFAFEVKARDRAIAADSAGDPFPRRQNKRRLRIAASLCVLGLLMIVGGWVDHRRRPAVFVASWLSAMLVVLWILWLAALDFFATRLHWTDQLQRNRADIAKTRADLRAAQRSQGDVVPPVGPQGN